MKHNLFAITAIAIITIPGCSKDVKNDYLEYVKIELAYDTNGRGPEGTVYLFYIENEFVDDPTPLARHTGMPYIRDVNGDYVFSIAKTNMRINKDLETGQYLNKSTAVFATKSSFSSLYGTCKTDGKYVVFIDLDSAPYSYTWKEVNLKDYAQEIENYAVLGKTFKRNTDYGLSLDRYEEW